MHNLELANCLREESEESYQKECLGCTRLGSRNGSAKLTRF
jgi:hypothetical protein